MDEYLVKVIWMENLGKLSLLGTGICSEAMMSCEPRQKLIWPIYVIKYSSSGQEYNNYKQYGCYGQLFGFFSLYLFKTREN